MPELNSEQIDQTMVNYNKNKRCAGSGVERQSKKYLVTKLSSTHKFSISNSLTNQVDFPIVPVLPARRKGILKRMQESFELMAWKYSSISIEEELQSTISFAEDEDDTLDLMNDSPKTLWTKAEKKLISKFCENKPPQTTFFPEITLTEDSQKLFIPTTDSSYLLKISDSKMCPVFKNFGLKNLLHNDFLLSTTPCTKGSKVVENKTMLNAMTTYA